MRLDRVVQILILGAVALLGATACSSQGFPRVFTPSSCAAGGDRCAALGCPPGTHCALTSGCTAFCEQEQLSRH